jgi:hypothetical protein
MKTAIKVEEAPKPFCTKCNLNAIPPINGWKDGKNVEKCNHMACGATLHWRMEAGVAILERCEEPRKKKVIFSFGKLATVTGR